MTLKINTKLSWKTDDYRSGAMADLEGVWGYAAYLISEDDLIENAGIDQYEINVDPKYDWVEYTKQSQEVCDKIAVWVENKANLPAGLPLCEGLGLPCDIDFLDYEVVEDENE